MATNIYVLRLAGGKYYVGKSDDPMGRYQQHLQGKGSSWTRKYKPIGVEKIISNTSPFDEDKVTKEMMAKYGIDNVRGGAYVSEELDDIQEESLRREIWGAQDRCTCCGRKGHFVKDCYANTDIEGNELEEVSEPPTKKYQVAIPAIKKQIGKKYEAAVPAIPAIKKQVTKRYEAPIPVVKKQVTKQQECFRCGRTGHYANSCYAKTTRYGSDLDSDSDDYDSDW